MSNFFGFGFAPATPGNNRPYHFQVIPITTLVPGKLNKISYLCVDFCAPEVQNEGKLTKKGPGGFGSGVIAGGPGRACLDTVQPQRASRFHRAATSRFGPR